MIPDSVTIGGTFRAFSIESLMQLKQRIEEVYFLFYLHGVTLKCKNDVLVNIYNKKIVFCLIYIVKIRLITKFRTKLWMICKNYNALYSITSPT